MRIFRVALALASALAVGSGASLLQTVDKRLPTTTSLVHIDHPLGSACADGAIWLCWWQSYPSSWSGNSVRPDIGVFCRLYDHNGRDLVKPMRIAAPRVSEDAMTDRNPGHFLTCATPDGGLVVFMSDFYPAPPPETDVSKVDRPGKRRTRVVYVTRGGHVGTALLDYPTGITSHTKAVFGVGRLLHLFTNDIRDHAHYARLALGDGRLSVLDTVALDLPVPGTTRLVSWVHDDNIRVAARILGGDTLLVVQAGRTRDFDRSLWESPPSGRIVSYRLKLPELTLIDSVSGFDSTLAGVSSIGAFRRQASLVKTKQGLLFYLPYPQGMRSFVLDTAGKPVLGARSQSPVRPPTGFGLAGAQFLKFTKPSYRRPWVMEWYGLDDAGNSYYDIHRADSVFGRLR
jgi:hypothetical protein